ncbi:MAG: oligosaccharide flippase family protein, partial [Candidatus Omnitrophica bacterium]|nr:oligosaccharide flippase family protein [Candidatus Omnitrophota bacterium]
MRFLKNIGWTTLAQTAASAAAFAYTLIAARTLGVENYGLFQAVMAIYGLFSFIHLPFYFGSAHCVGRSRAEKRPRVLGAFFTLSLIVAGLTLAIFSVSSSAGSSLLKTSNNA